MMTILPSIASANQAELKEEINRLKGHPYLHFDVEDGNFVPNITFGLKTIRALRPLSSAAFDAHLMVTNPLDYIDALRELNFQAIAFHWESTAYPMRVIHAIQDSNCRAGIALNPRTPAAEILPYLDTVDYVLVMTSEPDGRGDLFQAHVLDKIRQLRAASSRVSIVADGGIDKDILSDVRSAGADTAVIGRGVFSAPDPAERIRTFSMY